VLDPLAGFRADALLGPLLAGTEAAGRADVLGLLGENYPGQETVALAGGEADPADALVRVTAANREGPLPAPQAAGVLPGADAFDLDRLASDLEGVLVKAGDMQEALQGLLDRLGPWPWICVGVAMAASACEMIRRRQEQLRLLTAAAAGEFSPSWLPDPEPAEPAT
jgi:hypothetical protein